MPFPLQKLNRNDVSPAMSALPNGRKRDGEWAAAAAVAAVESTALKINVHTKRERNVTRKKEDNVL